MDVIIERACGMDVHKDNITACIMTPDGKEIQTFSTKTVHLIQLVDWIIQHGCTHVAMESTSVYWKPIVNLLEAEDIEFLVVNAQHIKAVPGRKTDVKDAEWIAQLLRHELLKASYIPDRNQRELRELVRYRRSIIEERARQHNRIQKVLEGANIKLGSVVSDIMGLSSKNMLHAIAEGEDNPVILANFAQRTLERKKAELELALKGYVSPHQRLMLKTILSHIEFLTQQIGLVPGHDESAGKRKSAKIKKGNKYLRAGLTEAAHSLKGSKNYLGALYRRTAARKGKKRAGIVVAHAILRISYYLLTRIELYVDLGEDYFDKQRQQSIVHHALRRLEGLGYTVSITEPEAS